MANWVAAGRGEGAEGGERSAFVPMPKGLTVPAVVP